MCAMCAMEWVMSNIAHMNPWLIHVCAMTHSYVWHVCDAHSRVPMMARIWMSHGTHMNESWVHVCDITHSRVPRIKCSCVCECERECMRVDPFICVTWLSHMCGMTHSCVWHDSFICVISQVLVCVTERIDTCDMTHSYVWHDWFICVPWLIHMCDMTHSYVWHDHSHVCHVKSDVCQMWLTHTYTSTLNQLLYGVTPPLPHNKGADTDTLAH